MVNPKESPMVACIARKLIEDQFVYGEEPAEARRTPRERLVTRLSRGQAAEPTDTLRIHLSGGGQFTRFMNMLKIRYTTQQYSGRKS